ncbi:hypothetical protein LCGC14_1740350 [marine sediment metagenome]|uniref:Calcineurin-like phosphoesterase domain-containing protein n=1 Tax=marine sediment metagenome TaxID=412755 RepID=A0A0F9K6L2_9ZZZZ
MKIIAISDTHGKHRDLEFRKSMPAGDMIIHAGDVSNVGTLAQINDFLYWFGGLDYEHKIFIAGNHDFMFEQNSVLARNLIPEGIHYLEDSSVTIDGIKIYGTPHSKLFMKWAFNRNKPQRKALWELIPEDVDILVSHAPVYRILDAVDEQYLAAGADANVGCPYLRDDVLFRIKPDILICGHIHNQVGTEVVGNTTFYNVSVLNELYQCVNEPTVIEYDRIK